MSRGIKIATFFAVPLASIALFVYLFFHYRSNYVKIPPQIVAIFQDFTNKEIYCPNGKSLDEKLAEWGKLYNNKNSSNRVTPLLGEGELKSYINYLILRKSPDRLDVIKESLINNQNMASNNNCLSPLLVSMLNSDAESFNLILQLTQVRTLVAAIKGDLFMYGIYFCDPVIFKSIAKNREFYEQAFWRSINYSPLRFAAAQCPDLLPYLNDKKIYRKSFLEKIFIW